MLLNRPPSVILKTKKRFIGLTCTLLLIRLIQAIASPFILLYLLLRAWKDPEYRKHFEERFGFISKTIKRPHRDSIWIHAVSVGEVASAAPLLAAIRKQSPEIPLFLSTGTVAGRRMATSRVASLVDGVFYVPTDYVSPIRRTLRWLRPSLLIILETEIWPNLLNEVAECGAGILFANARISDRAWPRYHRFRQLFAPLLSLPAEVSTQSETDSQRFRELGTPPSRMGPVCNLKYDAAGDSNPTKLHLADAHPVWISASTVGPDERGGGKHQIVEEELVLQAFESIAPHFPSLLLILAPRQPFRFSAIADLLAKSGVPYARRSHGHHRPATLPGILLLDTVGELAALYPVADLVFVGGSIAPRGGHNILEPACAGKPIIVGPHMHNFQSIAADFQQAQAFRQLKPGESLGPVVHQLLLDRSASQLMGFRARQLVTEKTGASEMLARRAVDLALTHRFRSVRSVPKRLALSVLSAIWTAGGKWKRKRAEESARRRPQLAVPVISIGGITLGGSGKTPFTNYLAGLLHRQGAHPGILTRGYRRRLPAKQVIALPGASAPTALTGDEAQIYLRAGIAGVGIASDRYEAAKMLLRNYPEVDILLLDDGFQHARLPRDLDIVLIDGLDPFGDRATVPSGRLREPLSALDRADLLVVTRCPTLRHYQAICTELSQLGPSKPCLRASLQVRGWRDARTGDVLEIPVGTRVLAFCGLGNPDNFWATLDQLGMNVAAREAFPDHHVYKPSELRLLGFSAERHQVEVLVTTEKDVVNFPDSVPGSLHNLPIAWLEVELKIDHESELLQIVNTTIERVAARGFSAAPPPTVQ